MTWYRLTVPGGLCLIICLCAPAIHAEGPWHMSTLRCDGGGWVTGMVCHPAEKDLRYIRTDVGGAYRWSPSGNKWVSIHDWVTYDLKGLGGVDAIAIDPNNTDLVYMAVGRWSQDGGVYRSADRGKSFTRLNFPHPTAINGNDGGGGGPGKRTRGERLQINPFNSQEMLLGIIQSLGGLWKSTDGGRDWTRLDLPGLSDDAEVVTAVLYDRFKQDHFYAVVPNEGLYQTTNGGDSFTKVNCPARDIRRMEQAGDGTIYFTNEEPGNGFVYRMVDGVAVDVTHRLDTCKDDRHTWVEQKGLHGIAVNLRNPDHVVVQGTLSSVRAGYPVPMYETLDRGESWRRLEIVIRSGPAWTSLKSIWAGVEDEVEMHVMLSTVTDVVWDPHDETKLYHMDGGGVATLALRNDTLCVDQTAQGIEETVNFELRSVPLPGKEHILSGCADRGGFFHSDRIDEQPEIQLLVKDKLQSIHSVNFCWSQPTRVYFAGRDNDDRVTGTIARYCYRSDDGGITWSETGYPGSANPLSLEVSATDPDNLVIFGGGNPSVSFDGGSTWQSCIGLSDVSTDHNWLWVKFLVADPVDGGIFYAYEEGGIVKRSIDGGRSWSPVNAALPDVSIHHGGKKLVATPHVKGHLWMNFHEKGLWRSIDGGRSWSEVPGFTNEAGARVVDVGVSPDGNEYPGAVFVVGRYNGMDGLWVSLDAAATWNRVTADGVYLDFANNLEASNYEYGLVLVGGAGRGAWYLKMDGASDNVSRNHQNGPSRPEHVVGSWNLYDARGRLLQSDADLRNPYLSVRRGRADGLTVYHNTVTGREHTCIGMEGLVGGTALERRR